VENDVDAAELAKLDMEITEVVQADAAAVLAAWLAAGPLPTADRTDWLVRCRGWKERYPVNDGNPFPSSGTISHYQFVDALSAAIPPDTLITTGSSGLAIEAFYSTFRNKPGQRLFLTSGLGAMGYGLPAAIGACLGNGCQPMVALESDGSLQLNLQELATLAILKLPICLFILNNDGYASIRNTQRNYFAGRYLASGPTSGLTMPSLEKLAETYGLGFMRIADGSNLSEGIVQAQTLPRPCLIEIRLVADESLEPKCAAIPRPDGSIISMPLEDMSPLLPIEVLELEMSSPVLPASYEARKR